MANPSDLLRDLMQRAIKKLTKIDPGVYSDIKAENCSCMCVYPLHTITHDINVEIQNVYVPDEYGKLVSILSKDEALYIIAGNREKEPYGCSPYKKKLNESHHLVPGEDEINDFAKDLNVNKIS